MRIRQKLFQSAAFITHWLKAVNEHALHPPFIFEIYTKVIMAGRPQSGFKETESLRQELLNNHTTIEITELGAGSGLTNSPERKISHIARHSLTPPPFSRLMYRLIRHMGARYILELGTSLGINTLYLAEAAPAGEIFTLEGCPRTASIAGEVFNRRKFANIHLKEGPLDLTLPELLKTSPKVDLVYMDANHTYAATLRYFKMLLPFLHADSVVIIDDIYWSAGMKKAWREIQQHGRVSLTIDLFEAGILFFRPGLQKEHYILEL